MTAEPIVLSPENAFWRAFFQLIVDEVNERLPPDLAFNCNFYWSKDAERPYISHVDWTPSLFNGRAILMSDYEKARLRAQLCRIHGDYLTHGGDTYIVYAYNLKTLAPATNPADGIYQGRTFELEHPEAVPETMSIIVEGLNNIQEYVRSRAWRIVL